MTLSEADIEDFIAALHDDPRLKDRVRNAILSDDFLALPGIVERLGERMDQLSVRVDQLGMRMESLVVQVQQMALKMDRFDGRLGNLEGEAYETRYVLHLGAHLARTLRQVRHIVPADLDDLAAAYRDGAISDAEWDEIHRLDVLAAGRPAKGRPGDAERFVALELSLVVDESDVDRAARRAAILREHGIDVSPAVDGKAITADAEQRAYELGVEVLVRKVQPAA